MTRSLNASTAAVSSGRIELRNVAAAAFAAVSLLSAFMLPLTSMVITSASGTLRAGPSSSAVRFCGSPFSLTWNCSALMSETALPSGPVTVRLRVMSGQVRLSMLLIVISRGPGCAKAAAVSSSITASRHNTSAGASRRPTRARALNIYFPQFTHRDEADNAQHKSPYGHAQHPGWLEECAYVVGADHI